MSDRHMSMVVFSAALAVGALQAAPLHSEPGFDLGGVTFDFPRLSAQMHDAKGNYVLLPKDDEVVLELAPHSMLGGDFAISAGQCGTVGFKILRGKNVSGDDRKGIAFRLTLPPGYAYVGSGFADRKTLKTERLADGSTVTAFDIRPGFSLKWMDYHRMTALVRATGKVGDSGPARLEVTKEGRVWAKPLDFRLFTIGTIAAECPSRYMNGLFSSGESTYFYGDRTAEEGFAELLEAAGVQWMIPERSDPATVALWRRHGVKKLTPPIGFCNAYMLTGRYQKMADGLPDADRFKADKPCGFGNHYDKVSVCPFAVIDERPYFVTNLAPNAIARPLEGMDGSWVNWEPHMFEGRGCVCPRCQEEFAKWKARTGSDDVHAFRSQVHARYVKTLDKYVRAATGGEKSVGLVLGVCWRACTTAWRKKLFSAEFKPIDYLADFEWFDPWGPYIYWNAEKPLGKNERDPLWHWFFAKDMRAFADGICSRPEKGKLQAFPHAQQGHGWVTQPEHFGMAMDAFFFNRFENTTAYLFPNGCDARYWKAFADATTRAARCEAYVWDGECCDEKVSVDIVPEFAPRRKLVSDYVPSSTNQPLLQCAVYDLKGVRLVAALNFCDDAPAFFTLKAADLEGDYRVVDEDGSLWYEGRLGEGAFLMVGAARTKVF